jgi:ATP-dependent Clp protease ATP-binding subunit ClpC
MSSSNFNNRPKFVNFLNFNEEANKILNKAIYYSMAEDCSSINEVHLFLALVEKTSLGNKILNQLDTTFDMLYNSYQFLASTGEYGTANNNYPDMPLDNMTRELYIVLVSVTNKTMTSAREVTPDDLFRELLSVTSKRLDTYLDYIGISFDDIMSMSNSEFYIPEELADFIKDMKNDVLDEQESIVNVDNYVDDIVEILGRKKKANPCLVGEPGVGKTAIVKRLVQRMISGEVPSSLMDTHICEVQGSTISAGTRFRGDLEERVKAIVDWASTQDVILFVDEIHTFLTNGDTGHGSESLIGNAIKQGLSDGSMRLIGATTLDEYHKSIEKDKAFNRRIQLVEVKEPTIENAITMIKESIVDYRNFHHVEINEEVIEEAVRLSDRYLKNQYLPDKAYTVIDQTCARIKLTDKKYIDKEDIKDTISKITGIKTSRLEENETDALVTLEKSISKRLIGQKEAVKTAAKSIRRAKAGVSDSGKPLASLMFVGPTGVGKTELCKVLSEEIGIGKDAFVKLDMSEFNTKESVNKLLGSDPGYIGYGEEPKLLKRVKHNPESVVLFDEIEKAHPSVFDVLLQLLDEGRLTSSLGETVDFTNCVVVMTSNAGYGADGMNKRALGFDTGSNQNNDSDKEKIARKALEETFKPEFLNRIDNIVIFEKLSTDECKDIVKLMLNKLNNRMAIKHIKFNFGNELVDRLVEVGYSDKYGARNLKRGIQDIVEDAIADAIIAGDVKENSMADINYNNVSEKVEISNIVEVAEVKPDIVNVDIRKTPLNLDIPDMTLKTKN